VERIELKKEMMEVAMLEDENKVLKKCIATLQFSTARIEAATHLMKLEIAEIKDVLEGGNKNVQKTL